MVAKISSHPTTFESLLTEDEAALLLGCSPGALRVKRARRRGPPYIKDDRSVRYHPADIAEYVAKRRIVPGGSQ